MPTIKIHRKKDWWTINSVPFEIYLNGQRIGYIQNETNEFDVPPGQNKLRLKTGGLGSKEHYFNTFNKEIKSFIISSRKNLITLSAILFLGAIEFVHLGLKIHTSKKTEHLIYASLIVVAIMLQTFGRRTYIFIKEKK